MATNKENLSPPTYDEVMQMPTPYIGVNPNSSVTIGMPPATAPPAAHIHTAYVPSYGSFETPPVSVVVQPTPVVTPNIIVIGGCPSCRIGALEESYSCLGLLCAILFFPVGILCCLAMKTKRCSNCGFEY